MTMWFDGSRPIETMSPNSCVPRSTSSQFRTKRAILRSFYGNGGTKFPDKIQAVGKLAGSYEYTNTTVGNVLDGAISRAARAQHRDRIPDGKRPGQASHC